MIAYFLESGHHTDMRFLVIAVLILGGCSDKSVEFCGKKWAQDAVDVKCGVKDVTDLSPLAGMKSLQWLGLANTQVSDLKPLAELTTLKGIILSNTQVTDLTPLAGLPALERLTLEETGVTDLTPLAGLMALENLFVRGFCKQAFH